MPLFAAHVGTSLVCIKLKLLPSGGERGIISLQLEAILLGLLSLREHVCEYSVCLKMCVFVCIHTYINISIYNTNICD